MKAIPRFIFLIFILNLILPFTRELIVNNPYLTNKTYNPVNYKIIILSCNISRQYFTKSTSLLARQPEFIAGVYTGDQIQNIPISTANGDESVQTDFKILKYYDKLYYNSYTLSPDFFAFIGDSNIKYFIFGNKLYFVEEEINNKYSFELKEEFYFSYIDHIKINLNPQKIKTIIYGKRSDNEICFYYIDSSSLMCSSDLKNIDDINISCKLYLNNSFICIYSQNNKIKLSILNKNKTNDKIINVFYTYDETNNKFFSEINEPILYDTDNKDFKVICGRKKDSIVNIKCILVNPSFIQSNSEEYNINTKEGIDFYNISEINATFSFNDNNCNYVMFKSEFLICCENIDVIICERRDNNLQLINSFNLTLYGNIKNLTLENHNDTYVELLYNNDILDNIYGYLIYPPKCNNINIISNSNSSSYIDIDTLFERKTNANYYITLVSFNNDDLELKINNNSINNKNETIKLEQSDNKINYKFKNNKQRRQLKIEYNISIDETYSNKCNIKITKDNCYHSCEECSLNETNSNITSHNCIKCKENYFPFPGYSSNCFNIEEMNDKNISYFFDNERSIFIESYPECQTCNGPNKNNCLICIDESLLIYNGECLAECPNGTFVNNSHKTCENFSTNSDSLIKDKSDLILKSNLITTDNLKLEIESRTKVILKLIVVYL